MGLWNVFTRRFHRTAIKRRLYQASFSAVVRPEELEQRELLSAANGPVYDPAAVSVEAAPAEVAPRVLSIVPVTPGTITTQSPSFTVTFNKAVTGVTDDNFVATTSLSPYRSELTVTVTPVSASVYTVTVDDASPAEDPGSAQNFFTLNFVDNGKVKAASDQQSLVGNPNFTIPGSSRPLSIPAATKAFPGDVNSDGKLDLIFQTTTGVMYSLGDGKGGFQNPVSINGAKTLSAVGDLNGDGKVDLISADAGVYTPFLGSGTGQFAAQTPIRPTRPFSCSAIGDFNNDGKADLAFGGQSADPRWGILGIALGNGNGTFQAPRVYQSTTPIRKLIAVDFDGNGKVDVVVSGPLGVGVLAGKGDGTFGRWSSTESIGAAQDVAVGDLNGDGRLDIAVTTVQTAADPNGNLFVLNGTGKADSPLSAPTSYKSVLTLGAPKSLAIFDTNGDGTQDLTWGTSNGYAVYMLGTSTGLVGNVALGRPVYAIGALEDASVVTAGDFTNDGKLEPVFLGARGNISAWVNQLNGSFNGPQRIPMDLKPSKNPPNTTFSGTSIAENKAVGSVVGKFATKATIKKTTYTYSLVPGAEDNAAFRIEGASLILNQALNFEAKSSYTIQVKVTNSRFQVFQRTFTIKVTDVSEPIVVAPQTFTVTEKSPNSTSVGKVTFTGGGPGQKIKYAITGGNTDNVFAINQTTGEITVANGAGIVQATNNKYTLAVSVTSTIGKKTVTSNGTVTVNVLAAQITPRVVSITAPAITGTTAVFTVTFNEDVTGVSTNNFSFAYTSNSVKITNWPYQFSQVSGSVYTLTFTGLAKLTSAPGTLKLVFADQTHTVRDAAGKTIAGDTYVESAAYDVNTPVVNPPVVQSISRDNNDPVTTNSTIFTVTFSRDVSLVTRALFQVVTTGGATADPVVSVTPVSGSVYNVAVSGITAPTGGTISLKLFDKYATVYDSDYQVLGLNYTFDGTVYNVQAPTINAPAVESIVLATDAPITTESADFIVTFNHAVTGVAAGQFFVTIDGTAIANDTVVVTQLSPTSYKVTVSGIDVETTGGIGLSFFDPEQSVIDSNLLTVGSDFEFDSEYYPVQLPNANAPTIVSLTRGTTDPVTAESTQFTVSFSKPVTGVDASNFVVVTTGGVIANATVVVTRYNETQWIATVTGIDFETAGTLGVNFTDPEGQVRDEDNYGLGANDSFTGETYDVQNGSTDTTPFLLSILKQDDLPIYDSTAEFLVTFNEVVTGITAANFVVNSSEGVTADATVEVTPVGGGMVYLVKVTNIETTVFDGTLQLDFFGSDGIQDVNNHGLPSGYSYGGVAYPVIL